MAARLPPRLGLLVPLVLLLRGVEGFLGRGAILEGHDDPLGVLCPDFDPRTPVWTHREITREGVRRAFVKYCEEVPTKDRVFNYRYGMTLEEVYQEKYGPDASPKRFLLALEDIVDAAAETDAGSMSGQPMYHFNNEEFAQAQALLEDRWRRVVTAIRARDVTTARLLLGVSLAALQDFYAHSNWVELGHDQILLDLGMPGGELPATARPDEETCESCPGTAGAGCESRLTEAIVSAGVLTSEYVAPSCTVSSPAGKCVRSPRCGGARSGPARGGLNKDLPSACYSPRPDLHHRTSQLAAQATSHYVTKLWRAVGDSLFSQLLSLNPTPAIAIGYGSASDVISSTTDVNGIISNVLDKLQAKHQTLAQPPDDYLLVLYSNSLRGGSGIYRSNSPAGLKEALQSSRFDTASPLINGPFSALYFVAHYAVPDTELFLITRAAPDTLSGGGPSSLHARELLLQKRIRVTPLLLSDDGVRVRSPRSPEFGLDYPTPSVHRPSNDTSNDSAAPEVDLPGPSSGPRRPTRKVASATYTYQALAHIAVVTGSHVIDVPRGSEGVAFSIVSQLLPQAQSLLYRDLDSTSPKSVTLPVDNRIQKVRIALHGGFHTAMLSNGVQTYNLLQERSSYSTPRRLADVRSSAAVDGTGPFSLWEFQRSSSSQTSWKLSYSSADGESVSVLVTGVSATDAVPAFYFADTESLSPSLQRLRGAPVADWRHFVDVVATGIDPSGLTGVKSVEFQPAVAGSPAHLLALNTTQPRRNTYVRLDNSNLLPREPFSVVYKALDSQGNDLVRISQQIYLPTEARVAFSRGREVWGRRGARLSIPFNITNMGNEDETYRITAADVLGFPLVLPQTSVQVRSNTSVTLPLYLNIPRQLSSAVQFIDVTGLPTHVNQRYGTQRQFLQFDVFSTRPVTNSLVVTASSTKGTSSSAIAYVVVASDVRTTPDVDADDEYDEYDDYDENDRQKRNARDDGDGHPSKIRHFLRKFSKKTRAHPRKSVKLGRAEEARDGHQVRKEILVSNKEDDVENSFQLGPIKYRLSRRSSNDVGQELKASNAAEEALSSGPAPHSPDFNTPSSPSHSAPESGPEMPALPPSNLALVTNQEEPQHVPSNPRPRRDAETNPWGYETNLSLYHPQRWGWPITRDFVGAPQMMTDTTPPTIEVTPISYCDDNLGASDCQQRQWTARVVVSDALGVQSITTDPYRQVPSPNGAKYVPLSIQESCCDPYMVIFASDTQGNTAQRAIGTPKTVLGAGAIAGIVIGCLVLLVIIVLAVVFIVRKRRSKQAVELRSQKVRTTEH